jgi:hypothetical protein
MHLFAWIDSCGTGAGGKGLRTREAHVEGFVEVTLSHSHTPTLSYSHTLTLSLSHTLTLSHSHTLTLSHSHTLTREAHIEGFVEDRDPRGWAFSYERGTPVVLWCLG